MASFSADDFQKLKEQVELLGLDEKQKNKFFLEEWQRMKEQDVLAAAEKRKLAAEAEERRLAAEVEARTKIGSRGRRTKISGRGR